LPADGASGVPINARLSAHYAPSAEYLNEAVPLEHVGVGPEDAPATFDANEGLLTIAPAAPLVANDAYKISWPALRGLTTAALGKGADVQFTAGSSSDVEAPRFSGMKALAWDVERSNDDCTDSPEDRYRFDFALGDASDDGPRDLLTLVVFQTAGPAQTGGSPEPVLIQRLPEPGGAVQVRRAIDMPVGRVTSAARPRLLGQVPSARRVSRRRSESPWMRARLRAVRAWYPMLGFWAFGDGAGCAPSASRGHLTYRWAAAPEVLSGPRPRHVLLACASDRTNPASMRAPPPRTTGESCAG
jgi:hypothetical protein